MKICAVREVSAYEKSKKDTYNAHIHDNKNRNLYSFLDEEVSSVSK